MTHPLLQVVDLQSRGRAVGIYSVCSANPYVLEAAMTQARKDGSVLLIEATSNQVDQFGGYTGMTPELFAAFVREIAISANFPVQNIILGGDHLGPNAWQSQASAEAMSNARVLMQAYVQAGFQKIHLDASMRCADDPGEAESGLDPKLAVDRAARLCKECEEAMLSGQSLYYVIGTEVPIPGGAKEAQLERTVTSKEEAAETIELTRRAFWEYGLEDAWQRVIAVVVQPGVEFGDSRVIDYQREMTGELTKLITGYRNLLYEAHSTDYQLPKALHEMVEDKFAILKVGPWLTFAFREAVVALASIESELLAGHKPVRTSDICKVLERVMLAKPAYWQAHYHGNASEQALARRYSYSDRVRYYWPNPEVAAALELLLQNLEETNIPLTILSQFMPGQYEAVRQGQISSGPRDLIRHKIMEITEVYANASAITEIDMGRA